jgi:RND family efflux transporter MFP subunit
MMGTHLHLRRVAPALAHAFVLLALGLALGSPAGAAPLVGAAGPYRVEVTTDPSPVPVGPATIQVHLTDAAGKDVAGASVQVLTQMPGMAMGERMEAAQPVAGKPGTYEAPANFQMAGGWGITVQVDGPQGSGKTTLDVKTGQSTTGGGGALGFVPVLWVLAALGLVGFVGYRMCRTGQRLSLRPLLNRQVIVGVLLLVAIYLASAWAVRKYTKPGHMSVIEAQAMDMTVMKPPVGAVPVAAMAAKRQAIDATVRYTGSAVAFTDQDVYPRVTGWITWMPFYPGQQVHPGQLLARLDARELGSRVSERAASEAMAEHQQMIAQQEARQARAQVSAAQGAVADARQQHARAQAAVQQSRSELAEAKQEVVAAQEERVQAEADLASAQSGLSDAEAGLSAAQADQEYWRAEIQREAQLLKTGAVSAEEYQREKAQAESADARVRQAQAKLEQTRSAIRSAQSKIRRAEAMIAGADAKVSVAEARVEQAKADVGSAAAKVSQMQGDLQATQAAAEAAIHRIAHTAAGVREAQAMLNTAGVVRDYTEIRSPVEGMITQRLISPGVLVNPGQAILRISQIRPMRLQANVAESDLPNIRVGNRVRVRTMKDPARVVEARVTSIFPAFDPVARTAVVEAIVPNAAGPGVGGPTFLPGQYLTMDITTGEKRSALVVPSSAVVWQPKASSAVLATDETPAVWVIRAGQAQQTTYTCTMHPEVKQDKPGKCPT